jgi:hypothetical protein
MDLNHARLPIPPRWQSELQCSGGPKGRRVRKINASIFTARYQPVKQPGATVILRKRSLRSEGSGRATRSVAFFATQ